MNEAEVQELGRAYQELAETWLELWNLIFNKWTIIILLVIGFCIFFFSYRRVYRKQIIKQSRKTAKIDMTGWVKWYRELPAAYSPAVVSLLCDFQQELHKDLAAVILYLCVNDYIYIHDNGYEVRFSDRQKDLSNLMYHEKYVLHYILGRIAVFDNNLYHDYIMHDAQLLSLVVDRNKSKHRGMRGREIWAQAYRKVDVFGFIISSAIGFLAGFFIIFSKIDAPSDPLAYIVSVGVAVLGAFFALFLYMFVVRYILILFVVRYSAKAKARSKFDYLRTEKGEYDYKNWLAFKQFLVDFSMIDTRDFNEVYIWEHYLAYATALGCADQIMKTSDARIIYNHKFRIINYDRFIASMDKRK